MNRMIYIPLTLGVFFAVGSLAAQDVPAVASNAGPTSPTGAKRAVLICGLSGDAERHKSFAETVTKVHLALTTKLGFDAQNVEVLFGDEPKPEDAEPIQKAGRATREELEKRVQTLREKIRPEDGLWVIVFGHSYYDRQHSWLNLPGPDMHQIDFAKLFGGIAATEQVFIVTTPTSGFYVRPLSAKNRIVISATEADWETNETEFGAELARVLSSPPPATELDADLDGQISVFDLYITIARNLAQSFKERDLLATEHPLLDDNGDGRGTELQIDFLTAELGGRAKPGKIVPPTTSLGIDGYLSKSLRLTLAP